jgi:cytochrome P450
MNTPAPQSSPRIASENTELGGVFIPKGSTVIANMHDLHHSESVWKDSFVFNPERFADSEGSRVSEDGVSWTPFGYGGRQCIGMNFSLNEQRVVLSMLCKCLLYSKLIILCL